jgi:metal-responsive CopG/Arc/MetJ family transcriptional regulator
MARKDWYYINIANEQAEAIDRILSTKEGRKCGISDRVQLIRTLVADFIEKYEKTHDLVAARKAVSLRDNKDAMQPLSIMF